MTNLTILRAILSPDPGQIIRMDGEAWVALREGQVNALHELGFSFAEFLGEGRLVYFPRDDREHPATLREMRQFEGLFSANYLSTVFFAGEMRHLFRISNCEWDGELEELLQMLAASRELVLDVSRLALT